MPQSGERIRGLANNRTTNENYPGLPNVKTHRITGSPDKWVTTPSFTILKITGTGDDYTTGSVATYPDGSVWHAVDIFHFRAGKILHHVAYFAAALEAPEWRAPWGGRFLSVPLVYPPKTVLPALWEACRAGSVTALRCTFDARNNLPEWVH